VRQSWRRCVAEARALTQRGLEDTHDGRFREAALAWEKAIQLAPNDPRARSLLEFARSDQGT